MGKVEVERVIYLFGSNKIDGFFIFFVQNFKIKQVTRITVSGHIFLSVI